MFIYGQILQYCSISGEAKLDRRSEKTQKAIRNAFLTLLERKSISKITIAEISELADLGRGTFYLHYKDIYALYEEIENSLYSEIEQLLDRASLISTPENLLNLISEITEHIVNNRATFLLITNAGYNTRNLHKLKKLFYRKLLFEDKKPYTPGFNAVNCIFAISGIIGITEEWLFNGLKLTKKQLVESIYDILEKFKF